MELPSGNLGKGCQRGILSPSSHHAAPDHQHNAKENENRAPARLLTLSEFAFNTGLPEAAELCAF